MNQIKNSKILLDFVAVDVVRIESKDDCLISGVDCFNNDFSYGLRAFCGDN